MNSGNGHALGTPGNDGPRTLGGWLRSQRLAREWTGKEMARRIHSAALAADGGEALPTAASLATYVGRWEQDAGVPGERYQWLYCTVLGVTPAQFGPGPDAAGSPCHACESRGKAGHLSSGLDPKFWTAAEAAILMRVSKMTVYRMVRTGELDSIRVGRSFRIPEQAVRDYLINAGLLPPMIPAIPPPMERRPSHE